MRRLDETLAAALARVRDHAFAAIARDLPADVSARVKGRRLRLRGRGLGWRSLGDPRLRDFSERVR